MIMVIQSTTLIKVAEAIINWPALIFLYKRSGTLVCKRIKSIKHLNLILAMCYQMGIKQNYIIYTPRCSQPHAFVLHIINQTL